jgi:nitroimidazol reductase NimA-like FMN-containing flavoprotein (pyridoxamine 5'-phosphate oxidase superfamily)
MREPMELSSAQCIKFLAVHRDGRVAFTTPMGPRIVPVGYTFDGTVILFETAPAATACIAASVSGGSVR